MGVSVQNQSYGYLEMQIRSQPNPVWGIFFTKTLTNDLPTKPGRTLCGGGNRSGSSRSRLLSRGLLGNGGNGLLGDSLSSRLGSFGGLSRLVLSLGLLGGLLSLALTLDSLAELGEEGRGLDLLTLLIGSSSLLLLSEAEGQRGLALLSLNLLGLTVSGRGDLGSLCRDSSRRGNLGGEGLSGLNGGDHGSDLSDGSFGWSLLGGSSRGRLRLDLLLAEGEVTEKASALGRSRLSGLLLLGLLSGSGSFGSGSLSNNGRRLDSNISGGFRSSSFSGLSRGSLSGLVLSRGLLLSLLLLAEEVAEDRGTLAASRSALGVLLLFFLLLLLGLFLRLLLSFLLRGLDLNRLLLLRGRSWLEAL